MARRTKSDAEKTREQLLRVAKDVFATKGYALASLTEIVEAAGITKGALFHHFRNKEGLFLEVWTRLQLEMDEAAREAAFAARSRSDPYAAFLAGCRTYLDYAMRTDYQQIVLVDGPAVLGIQGWYESDHDLGNRNVRAGVMYLSRKGIVTPDRVESYAILLQSALNGAGFAMTRKQDGISADTIYDAFEALLRSLR